MEWVERNAKGGAQPVNKKEAPMARGLSDGLELRMALPVQLEGELKLPGVVGSGGLARAANRAGRRIAQLVHGKNVCVV